MESKTIHFEAPKLFSNIFIMILSIGTIFELSGMNVLLTSIVILVTLVVEFISIKKIELSENEYHVVNRLNMSIRFQYSDKIFITKVLGADFYNVTILKCKFIPFFFGGHIGDEVSKEGSVRLDRNCRSWLFMRVGTTSGTP